MALRFSPLIKSALVVSIIIALGGLLWSRQLDNQIMADQISTANINADTARAVSAHEKLVNNQIQQTLATTQAELSAKQAEVLAKQAEVIAKQKDLDSATKQLAAINKQLAAANTQIASQKNQISTNSAELSQLRARPPLFSFVNNSTTLTQVDQKETDVKAVVTAAYDLLVGIYSQPYLLHQVTITFVDSFDNPKANGETLITNSAAGLSIDIRIKDFDKNKFDDVSTIVHEMIHSFHGLAVLDPPAYEEGITVAATDVVLKKLSAAGTIPNFSSLYIQISNDGYLGSALTVPADRDAFYNSPNVSSYYQLIGFGWYQLYLADNNFFKNFNEAIYAQKRNGIEITGQVVIDNIKKAIGSKQVDGYSADGWLATKAFALK